MGRPRDPNARRTIVTIRLTDAETAWLDAQCAVLGRSRTQWFQDGLSKAVAKAQAATAPKRSETLPSAPVAVLRSAREAELPRMDVSLELPPTVRRDPEPPRRRSRYKYTPQDCPGYAENPDNGLCGWCGGDRDDH